MNQLCRFLILCVFFCFQTEASAQLEDIGRLETFKPHFGAGISYRYPGPIALETSFKPLHWVEAKLDVGYSRQKIGFEKQGRNQGYFGGLGLFFSTADRWQMQSRANKYGFIWGLMIGTGRMDYYKTIRYPGGVFDDRFEDFESNGIVYDYFDFKMGMEFIIKDKLSIQVFPIQLGESQNYRNQNFPIPNSPALWENEIRSGITMQYKFNASQ